MCDRNKLAAVAREEAERPYNGKSDNCASNIQDIIALFPQWSVEEANGLWCAAFVYHCVILAGFKIPVRPKESSCSLAGCAAWEEWAQADSRIEYHSGNDKAFHPAAGDVVLFDRVFNNTDHDHIGIVLENFDNHIITAEGNVENVSRILERKKDSHIRGYIRVPDNFYIKLEREIHYRGAWRPFMLYCFSIYNIKDKICRRQFYGWIAKKICSSNFEPDNEEIPDFIK